MKVKVYIAQTTDGRIVAAKLTHAAAHAVAKEHAPARVRLFIADKEGTISEAVPTLNQKTCN